MIDVLRRATLLLAVSCATPMVAARAQASSRPAFDPEYSRESRAAIGAHHLCAGLWVVGRVYTRSPADIIAQDVAPFRLFGWEPDFTYDVDSVHRIVTVRGNGIPARTAQYNGDQGCSIMPRGESVLHFTPVPVPRKLADASTSWPMGDANAMASFPDVKADAISAALDWGMAQQDQHTRAIVFVYRGKIVGERYAPGWTKDTPEVGWSEGKSITAALIGILVGQGALALDDAAPITQWHQQPNDPRAQIRVRNLMNMSSGLDFANFSLTGPESYTRDNKHMRVYFDGINVFEHSVNNPQEIPPNTKQRYRNSDPLTLGKIVRDKVEARGESYFTFPQRALFDKIGIRNATLETDAWGNFIMSGFDYLSARDWARFGLLHLQDGVWQGQRILPEGWTTFVSTPAPADPAKGYGALFWVNRGHAWAGVPEDAYWSAGAMGQFTVVIPSRNAVIVRMGPSPAGYDRYTAELTNRLLAAVP